jgi:hypothetical protein
MRKFSILAVFAFFTAWMWNLQAQQITASIHGTVTDATGGGVPGAEVVATHTQTHTTTTVTTEGDGTFALLNLPIGSYDVSVTKPGFRTSTVRNLTLALNQDYNFSPKLEIGQVSESVQVEARPVQVETTNTQLDTVIEGQTIVDMPLNGRNWVTLQQIAPGVMASSDRFTTNYSTNGAQTQQNSFLINGADAIDLPLNDPSIIPSPDAIAEFNLITSSINPEYGRNSGGILNATIKSGSNSFHGDAFEFYRDTFLNGRNLFEQTGPVFHQNQYGGTVGGPIIKNHTFFFLSYQGTRARQPQAGNTTTVFTDAQRGGSFPDIAASTASSPFPLVGENGATFPAGTPYSTIFPTGSIPAADINPISAKLLAFVPQANLGSNIYAFNPITTVKQDQGIVRVDHTMAHDAIWATSFIQQNPTTETLPFTGATVPGFGEVDTANSYITQADWTHTFNPTTLNELRASWLRFNFGAVNPQTPVLPSSLGFNINPQDAAAAGVPFIGLTGYFSLGFSTNGPQPRIDSTYELADNFSKVIGRHTLKFGFDGKRYDVDNPFFFSNNGAFSFGGTGPYSTGDPGADFLLGIPDSYAQSSGGAIFARTYEYYFYAQDSWKVTKNLTINYGTGYQIDTPLVNSNAGGEDLNCFIPNQQSTIFPTAPAGLDFPGDKGCTSSGYHQHYDHFGPRFGFAYSPDLGWLTGGAGKTVIRGGFGVYYNRSEEELTLQNLTAPPFSQSSDGIGDVGGNPSFASPFTDIATGQSIPNKFPFVTPAKGSPINFSNYFLDLNVVNPNFTAPYAMNYNLNIQRELPMSMILQVAYVGSQGRHLETTYEGNPITPAGQAACAANPSCIANRNIQSILFPTNTEFAPGNIFPSVGVQATAGDSSYNALQVSLNKRMSHGVLFQISYTYGHSIDDTSGFENSGFGARGTNPYNFALDRGDSAFDARNRLVMSYDWELPRIMHNNNLWHTLVDGWTFNGITTFQSGFPLEVSDTADTSLICNGASVAFYGCPDAPNYIGSGGVATYDARTSVNSKTASTPNTTNQPYYWFDPNDFAHSAFGVLGNEGRNNFHGPGINNTDLGLYKRFHYSERQARFVELRLEAFNVFNHTQFLAPSTNVNSSLFGITQAAAPGRVIQLGAKIYF